MQPLVPFHQFDCSEQQNSCLCVILLNCIVASLCVGAFLHILRNKEDLNILCNLGKSCQFANSAKPNQTLILDIVCNIVIHCLMSLILEVWTVVKHGRQEGKKGKRGTEGS